MTVSTAPHTRTAAETEDWQDWRRRREAEVIGEHGIAALTDAVWLDETPQTIPGLPGTWSSQQGQARHDDGPHQRLLAVGDSHRFGHVLVRVAGWQGGVAVRVFDPAAPARTELTGIDTFPVDDRWQITGRFEPAPAGSTQAIQHNGVGSSADTVAGIVRVRVADHDVALLAFPASDGRLQITFADTASEQPGRFRFLTLPRPEQDGTVPVDLNRAYLPPCTFSDHYLCPWPPPQNRLPFAMTAGESGVIRLR